MGTGGGLVVIDFSEQGNSAHFRGDGWSGQESDRVWAVGPRSKLRIPLQSSRRPMMLEVEIDPCRKRPMVVGQIVRITANGTAIGGVRMDRRSMIRCEIDPAITNKDGLLDLEFEFPGFYRPDVLDRSGDDRPLSGSFSFVRLYTIDMFKPGPHFPTSSPDIPVVDLLPPFAVSPADATATSAVYTFGPDGTALPFLRGGWGLGDDNLAWIVAAAGQIELPAPTIPGSHVLRLDARPAGSLGATGAGAVTILLDHIVIGQFSLDEPTTLLVPLPWELTEGRDTLPLSFVPRDTREPGDRGSAADPPVLSIAVGEMRVIPLPACLARADIIRMDQVRPTPPRAVSRRFLMEDAATLPAAIEAVLGMDTPALARSFESLGDNREFGVVQRKLGVEVLNLFGFSDANLADLIRALTDDLALVNDPASVTMELNDADPKEYVLNSPAYNLCWHTFCYENDGDQGTIWRDHSATLGYLRRKFYEGLRAGRKIYVVRQQRPIPFGQAATLLMELNRHGRATLLCVEPAPPNRRPGEVELLMPGLMRGYVGQFASDPDAESADSTDWLRVIANATLLNRVPVPSMGF
jgi:hypothetical protein